jgi:pyruvate formate lyase activating enzyme
VRKNKKGKLYTLVYDNIASLDFNYIEKAPILHFWPGSKVIELGTVGCNFKCKFCCAWGISQAAPGEVKEIEIKPERIVEAAVKEGCRCIVYTHTDPVVSFEYVYELAGLAKERGLFNVLVTNGYITPEALELIAPFTDVMSITPKSFSSNFYEKVCGARLPPVLNTITSAKKMGIHVEIAYVLIPGWTDDDENIGKLVNFVRKLDPNMPLIFLRYFPSYEMDNIPMTLEDDLNKARAMAIESGLKYVYVGNTYSNPGKHTCCPTCGEILIERVGERVLEYRLKGKECPKCDEEIPIIGEYVPLS